MRNSLEPSAWVPGFLLWVALFTLLQLIQWCFFNAPALLVHSPGGGVLMVTGVVCKGKCHILLTWISVDENHLSS